jgi:hypothetical protein
MSNFTLTEIKPKTYKNVDTVDFKYLVLSTGYTKRLLPSDEDTDDCYKTHLAHIQNFITEIEEMSDSEIQLLGISTHNSVHINSEISTSDDAVQLQNIINKIKGDTDNSLFFKVDNMYILDMLEFCKMFMSGRNKVYCVIYSINNIAKYDDILHISFDSESG